MNLHAIVEHLVTLASDADRLALELEKHTTSTALAARGRAALHRFATALRDFHSSAISIPRPAPRGKTR
jgi:hypothetical protein